MSLKKDLNKFKPRKEQTMALNFIKEQYNLNPINKFYLLDMPVGSGKSHLAVMISDWYKTEVNRSAKIDIVTNSKILQDQYSNTYSSISDLKGKDNYECINYACSCTQGSVFNKLNKTKCENCPYSEARDGYMKGTISLTNFHLYILYSIYKPEIIENRGSNVLIVDEAQDFDDVMTNFISIKITEKTIKKYKFKDESKIIKELKSVSTIDNYIEFLKNFEKNIDQKIASINANLLHGKRNEITDKRSLKISKILNESNKDVKTMKLLTDIKRLALKIEVFLKEYKNNPNNWVLETEYNKETNTKESSLEPIWAYDYLYNYVFKKYDIVILMSGTILDKNLFSKLNGIDINSAAYYSIESPFDVKSRPIYYLPVGKMTFKKKQETFKKYVIYLKKILRKYKDKKGIIHTNSFELANWIKDSIKDPRLIFHDSTNKDDMLKMHKESDKPTVLVSPSMDTGVSFDNDHARFQIIAKIPYPSLASVKNKLRQKTNPAWYAWKTSSSLQQACGRIVRSNSDWGDTIIIDASFSDIIKWNSNLMPTWFQESIKKINISN